MRTGIVLLLFCAIAFVGCRNSRVLGKKDYYSDSTRVVSKTYATTKEKKYTVAPAPGRPPVTLYTKDPKAVLYGNACVSQYMVDEGIDYQPWLSYPEYNPKKHQGRIWRHNVWGKTKLFFRKGPFWKSKLNRRIDECRKASGDFVG